MAALNDDAFTLGPTIGAQFMQRRLRNNCTLLIQLCDKICQDLQTVRELVDEVQSILHSADFDLNVLRCTTRSLSRQLAVISTRMTEDKDLASEVD